MPVPILKQGDLLIASVRSALSDDEFERFSSKLVKLVGQHRSRAVIIDLSVVDVMDSFASRTLRNISQMIRLRGAETVIVGIQPDVAFTMVQLGISLEDVRTALDLEDGLRLLGREV